MLITIRERVPHNDGFNAEIVFDNDTPYAIHVRPPFDATQEERLQWYFENHLEQPYLNGVRAQQAAHSVEEYGTALFNMLFDNRRVYARYDAGKQAGLSTLRFEIIGSPDFHRLHWEALIEPGMSRPFAVESPFVRKNRNEQAIRATFRPSPTLNVLIVTARPNGRNDVGYRTISRPLVSHLHHSETPVQMDILRPGTYKALVEHLEEKSGSGTSGYYHIIHFDLHGALLAYDDCEKVGKPDALRFKTRYGRPPLQRYEGKKAFLLFASDTPGEPDLVEAGEMAALLTAHQIPIAILNACQSAMQEGSEETSLASRLMQAGVQLAIGMAYSVTVTAAERMMTTLYKHLFEGKPLSEAIRRARLELHNDRERRGYFNMTVTLEDWLLPVVYQNRDLTLATRPFTPDESAAWYGGIADAAPFPTPTYGFFGRDIDILEIETRLLTKRNLLLVRGMGGTGKTTLLKHLAAWWQTTDFVDRVFYFGYDEKAHTRQQILHAIAHKLLTPAEYHSAFTPLPIQSQQAMLTHKLRANRHLLILDNLESITGQPLSIPNTLPPDEQAALHSLLRSLDGGKTIVLLGSRSSEAWLANGTFADNVYPLAGLDPQAASNLADAILKSHSVTHYREDKDFERLLKLLDGYPLALEVVLANLPKQTPNEILTALEAGDINLDNKDGKDKTESILQCIAYSHSNLDPALQEVLLCLAPFTSVLYTPALEDYIVFLKQQPALANFPIERLPQAIEEAKRWGLLSEYADYKGYLTLQPTFPYFLRTKWNAPEQKEIQQAVATAFRLYYEQFGHHIVNLMKSNDVQKKQAGQMLAHLEYENLIAALSLALAAEVSILTIYLALSRYLDATHKDQQGLELSGEVLSRLQTYPSEILDGALGLEFVSVLDNIATRQLLFKRFVEAETSYKKGLELLIANTSIGADNKRNFSATFYHQLGNPSCYLDFSISKVQAQSATFCMLLSQTRFKVATWVR